MPEDLSLKDFINRSYDKFLNGTLDAKLEEARFFQAVREYCFLVAAGDSSPPIDPDDIAQEVFKWAWKSIIRKKVRFDISVLTTTLYDKTKKRIIDARRRSQAQCRNRSLEVPIDDAPDCADRRLNTAAKIEDKIVSSILSKRLSPILRSLSDKDKIRIGRIVGIHTHKEAKFLLERLREKGVSPANEWRKEKRLLGTLRRKLNSQHHPSKNKSSPHKSKASRKKMI